MNDADQWVLEATLDELDDLAGRFDAAFRRLRAVAECSTEAFRELAVATQAADDSIVRFQAARDAALAEQERAGA